MKHLHVSDDLNLPPEFVTSTAVIYGGKGMGKTNLGSVLVEECARAGLKFSVIDPMGVWWGLRFDVSGKGPGVELLILGGIHGDIPIEPTGGAVVADLIADEDTSIVIDISRRPDGTMWSIAERVRFVTDYCKRLYMRQGEKRRPLMQLIDEAARFVPQTVRKGEEYVAACMGAVAVLVEEGRNVGIGVTLITQRSARLSKDVAELADAMIAFRTIGPNSSDAVLNWLGEHVEKKRLKDLGAKLRELPVGSALVVSPGWLKFEDVVRFRARTTFDSSATPKPGEATKKVSGGAKPDLDKYAARMAETIERAKATDPKALQAKVASLQAELKKALAAKTPPPGKTNQSNPKLEALVKKLQKAVEQAMKFIVTINTEGFFRAGGEAVDKAQIQKAIEAAASNVTKMLETKVDQRNREIDKLRGEASKVLASLKALTLEDINVEVAVTHNEPFTVTAPPTAAIARRSAPPRAPSAEQEAGDLGKGERIILSAIAQHREGVTREQLTVLTGYKRSTRDAYLQRLTARDALLFEHDRILAASVGLELLGADFRPLPTGASLLDHWRRELPQGERAVLDVAVQHHPDPVDREAIGVATGYKRSTRDAYIQRSIARRLLVDAGRGMVRASDMLFEGTA